MTSRPGGLDPVAVDHVLTTTRSVRRRLNLDRPVDPQLILDCIDVAEQAPSGGNQASRRWIVIDDERRKRQVADLYRDTVGDLILGARDQLAGSDQPQARVIESAAYLVEHLAEVPVIVIPTIIGRHDNSGRPGLFDSVIQAAWSFCLALRARGLGTAWVTAVLARERELKELLGIPDNMTEIVMLPVAHTVGTDFKRAPRRPAREITYFNTYGHTFERGPTQPATFADGAGGEVEIDVDATAEQLWPVVTDISFGADFSDEFVGAEWAEKSGPGLGARFVGRNRNETFGEWEVDCFVDRFEPNRVFGWCTSDRDNPGARWCFELEPIAGGTRLRHAMTIGPGPSGLTQAIDSMPDRQQRILHRRVEALRPSMQRIVEAMKVRAEASALPDNDSGQQTE